jgi:ABC-type branched-subunit amino acid transport system substrate-binding protein
VLLTVVLAACGSQISPESYRAANGTTGTGTGSSTGTTGDTGTGTTGGSGTTSGGGSTGGGTGSGGGSSTAGGGTSSGGGAAPTGSGINAANGGKKAASCSGFKNQTGITDSTITIANSSDISGPVPGLFEASAQATKAYVAYFNATSNICGRKLSLMSLDSRTDAAADQQAYAKACQSAFAAVGSMSAFDSGGASTAQNCGLPDIRSAAVTIERNRCTTCFGTQSAATDEFENTVPDYYLKHYKSATQHAAFLYINAGAAAQNASTQIKAMTQRGMKFVYTSGIDVAEFNYGPFVQNMKDKGVQWVQFLGAYQQAAKLAQAMQAASFKPQVYNLDPTAYAPGFVQQAGSAGNGAFVFINFTPFEEASSNKELQLYEQWLQQVAPGATPSFFGLFSWSATRLFVEQATQLGGNLSRATLVSRLKQVDNWTGNGIHSPQHVGTKQVGDCWRFIRLSNGKWGSVGGSKYICDGVTKVS